MEKNRIIWFLGIILMIMPLIILFIFIGDKDSMLYTYPYVVYIPLIIGLLLFIYGAINDKMIRTYYMVKKDERVQKIHDRSRSYSLYITIPFLFLIISLVRMEILPLNFIIVWLVGLQIGISYFIFKWYLNRKKNL